MAHDGDEGDLADVAGFAAHVGAGDEECACLVGFHVDVVGDVAVQEELFDHWVAALFYLDACFVCVFGLGVAGLAGDGGEGDQAV